MPIICREMEEQIQQLTAKHSSEEQLAKGTFIPFLINNCGHVFLIVHLATEASPSVEKELRTRLDSLEEDHQERLESLTNKCLAFEEELGK